MSAVFDAPVHTSARNLERVLAAKLPIVLVFETPGCEPCAALGATLDELARAYAGRALIVRVDNAEEGDLVARHRLGRVPTLVYWRDGREAVRVEGAAPAAALRAHLEYLLGQGPRPAPATGPSANLRGAPVPTPRPSAAPADGRPLNVTDATFESQVLGSTLPVLVDFWAPWCGPCRMVSPVVEEIGREYAGRLRVAKVNTDENPAWAGRLGIQGIPTLILFKNGREADRIVGFGGKAALLERVRQHLK